MKEPEMPVELLRLFEQENDRQLETFVSLISRWPDFRQHIACGFLGGAVAQADTVGVDVEGWLAGLRRVEPKPEVLVPPEGS